MKRALKRMIPLLLAVCILASIAWYLLVYDRAFTRDMLISQARFYDSNGNTKFAAMLYDWAYDYTGQDEEVAIELAEQYKADGNFTKAEFTLTNAIADGGTAQLYIALCKTFVEQDKLLDAVNMLDNIANPSIKAELDAMRPTAPEADFAPGYYSKYISLTLSGDGNVIYYTADGEYPSTSCAPYSDPIDLPPGETAIHALSVGENGLVSPLVLLGYTIGGVIEEAEFADPAVELAIREQLGADEEDILMTDMLWTITDFTVPEDAAVLSDLSLLPYLEVLRIHDFTFTDLSCLASLNALQELDLTGCRFPASELAVVAKLPELKKLILADCGLSTIADLAGASSLSSLDLSSNTLRNLEVLSGMSSLRELYLQHNAVTKLDALSTVTSLEKLDISYNSVTSLSPLSACGNLSWLNAGNNLLDSLQGVEAMRSLTHLDADHNSISDVSVLSGCHELAELNISNNSLTGIDTLAALSKLTTLDCSYNALTQLPAWSNDSALSVINGSYNQITSIDSLSNLENLTYVYMDYNQLTTVDPIADCFRLVMVNVYGNEISDVSKLTDHNIIVNYDPT